MKALTIAEIRAVASDAGYDLTGSTKAQLITSFLAAQDIDTTGTLTEDDLGHFTVAKILAIAEAREYTMTSTADTAKATVITEFLAAQEADT